LRVINHREGKKRERILACHEVRAKALGLQIPLTPLIK
jgi:hypothetical protein